MSQYLYYIENVGFSKTALYPKLDEVYSKCTIDGVEEVLNNYKIPFGVMFGRGASKLNGLIRRWLEPGDVTINATVNVKAPYGNWKEIISDPKMQWVASWKNELTDKTEYIYLGRSSGIRMGQN